MYNYRHHVLCLFLAGLVILSCCFPSMAQEEKQSDTDDDRIVLDAADGTFPLGAGARVLLDQGSQFTLQDVASKYRNNSLIAKNNDDRILLSFKNDPFWIVFHVKNNTENQDWLLDIGELYEGRSGIMSKFLLYEVHQAKIFYNGLRTGEANSGQLVRERYLPVTIPSKQDAIFLLYFLPTDYKQVSLKPRLIPSVEKISKHQAYDIIQTYLPSIMVGCVLLALVGFFVTSKIGFIPFILYYAFLAAWYIFIERPAFSDLLGVDILVFLSSPIIAIIISFVGFLFIPSGNNFFRICLGVCVIGCVASMLCFTMMENSDGIIRVLASQGLAIVTLFVASAYVMSDTSVEHRHLSAILAVWILSVFVAKLVVMATSLLYIPHTAYTIHADYTVLPIQLLIMFLLVVVSIRTEHTGSLNNFIRQTQKAQSLLKAKKNKEEHDNSKLLRVIEREREVMEELRAREADRTEEMRQAKISADRANHAKSAFLAVVSHEIRTPMTGVMGMLRMLEDTTLDDQQRDYVTTIKESGESMVALLNDILDFSKIEDGKMSIEKIKFDLHRVMGGVIMLMKGHADQKNVKLELTIDERVPHLLYGDPTRLRQVLLNLVGNALKFTEKGRVTLNALIDPVFMNSHKSESKCAIYFSVEDTGIGISEDVQTKLFTPFAQADESISRKFGGTGLGLSICQKLIEAMGGKIGLKSREGQGTTFYFTLPFSVAHSDVSGQEHPQDTKISHTAPQEILQDEDGEAVLKQQLSLIPKDKRLRFLVIDDNEINRKVAKAYLDKANHESVMIHSGREAIQLLKNDHRFDVIFLDIEMPDMNGREVARKILSDKNMDYIPIIALTGNVSVDDLIEYQKIGFEGCVSKPVTPEKLMVTVASILFGDKSHNGFRKLSDLSQVTDDHGHDTLSAGKRSVKAGQSDFLSSSAAAEVPDHNNGDNPDRKETADKSSEGLKKPASTGKTLDEAMIKGLRDGLGVKQTVDLLKDLFIKTDDLMEQLKKAIRDDDRDATRIRSHDIKGMSANFGLKAVSAKSKEIEMISRDPERKLVEIEPHLSDLENLIERSKLALNDFFSDK